MDLKGTVVRIFKKQQVSEKFAKRDFVIETQEKYPQKVLIQVTQDKCDLLDSIGEGEMVDVGINVRGREWTNPQGETKYFVTLEAWRISNESANNFKAEKGNFEKQPKQIVVTQEEEDDLPF